MNIVARVVHRLGFVRIARYDAIAQQRNKAEKRSTELAHRVEELRASLREWRGRAEGLSALSRRDRESLRQLQKDAVRGQKELERRCEHLGKVQAENARLRASITALEQRVVAAEEALVAAREMLMLVEVKLDILEGAATVLDRRSRQALAPPKTDASTLT
jgi:chromosome segregation ATPase